MEAFNAVLTAPLLTGWNSGFLRDSANLAIIVLSDVEDASPNPVTAYANFLAGLKPRGSPKRVTFSGVIPMYASPTVGKSCFYEEEYPSGRMISLIAATGGVGIDMCASNDLSPVLNNIAANALGARNQFSLTGQPDTANPITVSVNGQQVSATSSTGATQWTYDSASNSIVFASSSAPPAGASVTVSYRVACLPP
jgi:hypothetical protein